MFKGRAAIFWALVVGLGWIAGALPVSAQELPVEFCRTHERWIEKGQDPAGGGECPIRGNCDIPAERDSFIPDAGSAILFVNLKWNVFAEDDGANPAATQTEIDLQMQELNSNWADVGIEFLHETEFINSTEFRYWADNEEFAMKQQYADDPANKLNVYLVAVEGQYSFGTFPWDNQALTALGGIVMNEFQFGPTRTTLAHEIGHNLGLWHTHHGVSEVNPCTACYEVAGGANGDITGDFASDTDPTPTNFSCLPPPGNDVCTGTPWATGSQDYQNFMGYAPSSCRNFFSPHQQGRARCWFADVLSGWLSEPPALQFSYPQGLPEFANPAASRNFQLQVEAEIGIDADLGQAEGFVSIAGGAFVPLPLTHLGNNLYKVTLPPAGSCGDKLRFYFSAPSTDAQTFTDPKDAPTVTHETIGAFGPVVIFDDNFEADVSGWTINSDASVTSGAWEQADPIGTTAGAEQAAPGTVSDLGPQNVLVFVTENGQPGGLADDADVDGGPVDLISPVFDLAGSDGQISYNRWFFSDGADTLTVWITDNGSSWTLVETIDGTNNSWQSSSFQVSDFITSSATMQIRFRTGDSPDDSITEAAIDQFRVVELRCTACSVDADCTDVVFCNGEETCNTGICSAGPDPCPGLLCDELVNTCVDCFFDTDCDDGTFCNGPETCVANSCFAGSDPCPTQPCDDAFDVCIECVTDPECDDGTFCNGQEVCFAPGVCGGGNPACPGICAEGNDECVGTVLPQPRAGDPVQGLSAADLERFHQGLSMFDTPLTESSGLGPAYNATSCGSCHSSTAMGGAGTATETRFGEENGGAFDPLLSLGGSLLQSDGLTPACAEVVPPEANMTSQRVTSALYGAGMVEALGDSDIEFYALNPPGPVSGQVHVVPVLEAAPATAVGRFGWKSQYATLETASAEMALGSLGLTSSLLPADLAPNGDGALLASCDTQADPEDQPDGSGYYFTERVTDFQRFLSPPPQTPKSGMSGEVVLSLSNCNHCHIPQFTTPNTQNMADVFRNKTIRPFSDFLLHDMGSNGDPIEQGAAAQNEVRTAPLWGLRLRDALWHDGRISGGTVESRILAAILEHDAPGSEASASVQSFLGWPQVFKDNLINYLASLGRAEFDQDGDNDVDADDYLLVLDCVNGPQSYSPNDPCAVSDVDQDGDVDADDLKLFTYVADGVSGRVPDGDGVAGTQLTVEHGVGDDVVLSWGASCRTEDTDYGIYEGTIGDFSSHGARLCSTGGLTTVTFEPDPGSKYYLVVPTNGYKEGGYGFDGTGAPRSIGSPFCTPQSIGTCGP